MTDNKTHFEKSKAATDILSKYCWKKKGSCKVCRKRNILVSKQNLCRKCATVRMAEAATQLSQKQGKYHTRWKNNILKAVRKL